MNQHILKGKTQGSDECLLSRISDTHGGMNFVVVVGDRSGQTQRVYIDLRKLTVFWK